jgi:hypothetical protein
VHAQDFTTRFLDYWAEATASMPDGTCKDKIEETEELGRWGGTVPHIERMALPLDALISGLL